MAISTSEISEEISEILCNQIGFEVVWCLNFPFEEILLRMELRAVDWVVVCFECCNVGIASRVESGGSDLQTAV